MTTRNGSKLVKALFLAASLLIAAAVAFFGIMSAMQSHAQSKRQDALYEAEEHGFIEIIQAELYTIEETMVNDIPYLLINYGNTDFLGGSYNEYALMTIDTQILPDVQVGNRFVLHHADSLGSCNIVHNGESISCEMLPAYSMIGISQTEEDLWWMSLCALMLAVPISLILGITSVIIGLVHRKKQMTHSYTTGTILSLLNDPPTSMTVTYAVKGTEYAVTENVRYTEEPIKVGNVTVGQKRIPRLGDLKPGTYVTIRYEVCNPENAHIENND